MCWMIDSCWIKDFVCCSIPVKWGLAWKNLARKVALVAATCELAAKLQNNTRRRSPNISNWQIVQKYLASNCEGIFFTSIDCETQRFTDEVSKYFSPGAKYWSNTVCTWFWIIFKTPILLIETPDITFQGDFWNLQIDAWGCKYALKIQQIRPKYIFLVCDELLVELKKYVCFQMFKTFLLSFSCTPSFQSDRMTFPGWVVVCQMRLLWLLTRWPLAKCRLNVFMQLKYPRDICTPPPWSFNPQSLMIIVCGWS